MRIRIVYISIAVCLLIMALALLASAGMTGNLEPPGPPGSTSSHTLEDIYNRLNDGTESMASTFTEPSNGPGTGTMHTLDQIYDLIGERAPVPEAGQTKCYDTLGIEILCSDTGQDGEYLKGVAWPAPRFADNGDGTVTDHLTGLIWLRQANCGGERTWNDALTFANSLYDGWTGDGSGGDCGLSDGSSVSNWRLPNVKELHSLVHYGAYEPAVPNTAGTGQWSEGEPFTGVQSHHYWSSTTYLPNTAFAWNVGMHAGITDPHEKTLVHYVWPVRGGQ